MTGLLFQAQKIKQITRKDVDFCRWCIPAHHKHTLSTLHCKPKIAVHSCTQVYIIQATLL